MIVLSFNDTLIYGIGEMSALQDRLLRPVVAVFILVAPALILLGYGAMAQKTRQDAAAPDSDEGSES